MGWATHVLQWKLQKVIVILISKNFRSSDCKLQLVYMKLESLVIANQNVAVNGKLALYTPPVTCGELILFEELYK